MDIFKKYGLYMPEILLPAAEKTSAWAVVACDQYTQDKAYWTEAARIAEGKPSALHIILPEIYLNELSQAEKEKAVSSIQTRMKDYLGGGVFAPPLNAFIYVERTTAYGRLRKGLVASIDLEDYEWKSGTKAKIRATEATIVSRIPPRIAIRKNAPLESPHIMLLVNDKKCSFIEKTGEIAKREGGPLYDVELMMGAGHISGRAVSSADALFHMEKALASIAAENIDSAGNVFMFAVGDGNHSLATAKAVWDELKKSRGGIEQNGSIAVPQGLENHPCRYALVEIVNLYDEGLTFEPIHRIVFEENARSLASFVQSKLGGKLEVCASESDLMQKTASSAGKTAVFGFASAQDGFLSLSVELDCLAVSALQPVLDTLIGQKCETSCVTTGNKELIDYIHGAEDVLRLAREHDKTAVLLPPIEKASFFTTVEKYGSLPRKSFSMGEASEKRFYFECRRLEKD
ncbi:DUF1015 domain-containing protein [Treponema sp. HNW]|uniref:DUF1015 domain-containing protein n=1 Tax=Treponema sp. HNW TaxID=3116654 RepID=UPI003D0DE538